MTQTFFTELALSYIVLRTKNLLKYSFLPENIILKFLELLFAGASLKNNNRKKEENYHYKQDEKKIKNLFQLKAEEKVISKPV